MQVREREEKRLLPTEQAAKYLGMSVAAFRKNVYLRRIPGMVQIGSRNYFDKKKLDSFIDQSEIKIRPNGA